jgi:hypothetical protein
VKKKKVKKMRKVKVITTLSLAVLMLVSLSNTVSAEAVVGPPIGGNDVEFDFEDPLFPGAPVDVTISWWIGDDVRCPNAGTFNLHLNLKDSAGNEVWAEHVEDWTESPYETQLEAPGAGTYYLGVQIVATGCGREVGNSGHFHPFLVASEGGSFPEFPTIAIPVAAILGLLFFFNHRKRKKS